MSRRWLLPALSVAGTAGYAIGIERQAFVLRRVSVPVLQSGAASLRVLHISDAHMTPGQHHKQEWIRSLAGLEPDLVVNTGDNLGDPDAADAVLSAYDGLLGYPGVFVFGSNDYYSPKPANPLTYLRRTSAENGRYRTRRSNMPYARLRDAFTDAGWHDLSNARAELTINALRVAFAGVDDPHVLADAPDVEQPSREADIAVGVTHAPYTRVLDHWQQRGYGLIFAGHTHGGQVCVPGYGAVVTNCDLDRRMAKGLHRYPADATDSSFLHVSAGIGTSPWQPFRFACRPEATLLTLTG